MWEDSLPRVADTRLHLSPLRDPHPRIRLMLLWPKLLGAIPLQKLFGIPRTLLELTSETLRDGNEVPGALSESHTAR